MSARECRAVRRGLVAYLDGETAGRQAARINRHLAACPDCAREHAALADLKSAWRDVPAPAVESTPRERAAIVRGARLAQAAAARRPPAFVLGWSGWATVGALAVCAVLARSLVEGRRGTAPPVAAASRTVLTLAEYRARHDSGLLATDGRLSLGASGVLGGPAASEGADREAIP